jgi:hypothetical protein
MGKALSTSRWPQAQKSALHDWLSDVLQPVLDASPRAELNVALVGVQVLPPPFKRLVVTFGEKHIETTLQKWKDNGDQQSRPRMAVVELLHAITKTCTLPQNTSLDLYLEMARALRKRTKGTRFHDSWLWTNETRQQKNKLRHAVWDDDKHGGDDDDSEDDEDGEDDEDDEDENVKKAKAWRKARWQIATRFVGDSLAPRESSAHNVAEAMTVHMQRIKAATKKGLRGRVRTHFVNPRVALVIRAPIRTSGWKGGMVIEKTVSGLVFVAALRTDLAISVLNGQRTLKLIDKQLTKMQPLAAYADAIKVVHLMCREWVGELTRMRADMDRVNKLLQADLSPYHRSVWAVLNTFPTALLQVGARMQDAYNVARLLKPTPAYSISVVYVGGAHAANVIMNLRAWKAVATHIYRAQSSAMITSKDLSDMWAQQ